MPDQFTFIDLFAGVGGFHAALTELGGRCVYVAEKDRYARAVYETAWLTGSESDPHVTADINDDVPVDTGHTIDELLKRAEAGEIELGNLPKEEFDVLAAGFPCQAFSKSGKQEGILDKVRGTLFYNILVIVAVRKPKIVFLENVKNLVGPSHRDTTFATIVDSLARLGYVVNPNPTVFSPHTIAPEYGGGPQIRERVYILAVRDDLAAVHEPFVEPKRSEEWSPTQWQIGLTPLKRDRIPAVISNKWMRQALVEDPELAIAAERIRSSYMQNLAEYRLTGDDVWFGVYELLLASVIKGRKKNSRGSWFPGHPIWFDAHNKEWLERERADAEAHRGAVKTRDWKDEFLDKSVRFIDDYSKQLKGHGSGDLLKKIRGLPNNAWRKFEWQASDAESLDACLIQLRPSGVRVKKATYTPALVAMNQTPIVGSERRRITPYEAGRLQGFPDNVFKAMQKTKQPESQSYKQFGNAVHVGTVKFALVYFVTHHFGARPVAKAPDPGSITPLIEICRSIRDGWSQGAHQTEQTLEEAVASGAAGALDAEMVPKPEDRSPALAAH